MMDNILEKIEAAIEDIEKIQILFEQTFGEECPADKEIAEALKIAKTEHKELEQYRSIGTVEKCRLAMKKQTPDKPHVWGDGYDKKGSMIYDMYDCPGCGKSYEIDYDDYKYCPECGQAIELE